MLEALVAPATAPFTVAMLLMLLIAVVEAIGLTAGADLDLDDSGVLGGALDWLNVGRMPILMLLVVFLASFGIAGLLLQQAAMAVADNPLAWPLAVPAALAAAVPMTRLGSSALSRILPRDETTAVPIDSLVGRRARILTGTARPGSPARARVEDAHGQAHFVFVEPEQDESFTEGALILLTRRQGTLFHAIALEPDIFSELRIAP